MSSRVFEQENVAQRFNFEVFSLFLHRLRAILLFTFGGFCLYTEQQIWHINSLFYKIHVS